MRCKETDTSDAVADVLVACLDWLGSRFLFTSSRLTGWQRISMIKRVRLS